MPTGNIPETSEVRTPLHSGHLDGTNGVRIIEVPLHNIHSQDEIVCCVEGHSCLFLPDTYVELGTRGGLYL